MADMAAASRGTTVGGMCVAELHRRTEGWPAGLYLAALALQAADPGLDTSAAGMGFAGDDRFIVDYLNAELLSRLPPRQVSFLTRTAVLDRMCGPLCAAVLDTTGSAKVLESLAGSNLLLVPWTVDVSGTATTTCFATCSAPSWSGASPS
jgi:LuxR family transcriptional regulator, maltose regulon positive regulatory protein